MRTYRGDKDGLWAFGRRIHRGDGPNNVAFEAGIMLDRVEGAWLLSVGIAPGTGFGVGWVKPRMPLRERWDRLTRRLIGLDDGR